ncbi:hypothetical protein XENTR_v10015270 [Xenopus tropicalis]|nr:hypothetical protein XENTR_v10015270 [Xenopus tropicalis]
MSCMYKSGGAIAGYCMYWGAKIRRGSLVYKGLIPAAIATTPRGRVLLGSAHRVRAGEDNKWSQNPSVTANILIIYSRGYIIPYNT